MHERDFGCEYDFNFTTQSQSAECLAGARARLCKHRCVGRNATRDVSTIFAEWCQHLLLHAPHAAGIDAHLRELHDDAAGGDRYTIIGAQHAPDDRAGAIGSRTTQARDKRAATGQCQINALVTNRLVDLDRFVHGIEAERIEAGMGESDQILASRYGVDAIATDRVTLRQTAGDPGRRTEHELNGRAAEWRAGQAVADEAADARLRAEERGQRDAENTAHPSCVTLRHRIL